MCARFAGAGRDVFTAWRGARVRLLCNCIRATHLFTIVSSEDAIVSHHNNRLFQISTLNVLTKNYLF